MCYNTLCLPLDRPFRAFRSSQSALLPKARSFVFNGLRTLLNFIVHLTPLESIAHALFAKNTRGWGICVTFPPISFMRPRRFDTPERRRYYRFASSTSLFF